jgi:hypothetical protein
MQRPLKKLQVSAVVRVCAISRAACPNTAARTIPPPKKLASGGKPLPPGVESGALHHTRRGSPVDGASAAGACVPAPRILNLIQVDRPKGDFAGCEAGDSGQRHEQQGCSDRGSHEKSTPWISRHYPFGSSTMNVNSTVGYFPDRSCSRFWPTAASISLS